MPKITYVRKKFSADHAAIIERANDVIEEYAAQGYDLTLRQLYYQFVSRDWITNTVQSYKRLGTILSDARRAGLVDWERIVDRTRFLRTHNFWNSPDDIVRTCAAQFNVDFWARQKYRPEVWIEKDALVGVLEVACEQWQVPYFSCRGYTSDSEAWQAARRMLRTIQRGQTPLVIHLGDHDPSGIDMSRDIQERLTLFMAGETVDVKRIALNMSQVEEFQPPPNPAKETDSRFARYLEEYGDESWELDALNPTTIGELIAAEMRDLIDTDEWQASQDERDEGRRLLNAVSEKWDKLTKKL